MQTLETLNQKSLIEENIIDFIRKRNHASSHLDLFPNDIQAVQSTGYGRVILNGSVYIFNIIDTEEDEALLQLFDWDDTDNPIMSYEIDPSKAYSIYTTKENDQIKFEIGVLEVPLQTILATGWAFGLVAKNKVLPPMLKNIYENNMAKYMEKRKSGGYLFEGAYRPHMRKFCPWLTGTWIADSTGNSLNAKVYWCYDPEANPTHAEAIEVLTDIAEKCNTITAKNRIQYVISVLEERQNRMGEA